MTANNTEAPIDALLEMVKNDDLPVEMLQHHMAAVRKAHPSLAPRIDAALIELGRNQAKALEQLQTVLGELKVLTDKLSSPPLREGIFIGEEPLADGRVLARIASSHGEALLNIVDERLAGALQPGDRVYLNSESNAVLGKSEAKAGSPGECAVTERWLDDRRLVVRHHDRERVVRAAASLTPASLSGGDIVRLDPDNNWFAMERVGANPNAQYAAKSEATCLPPEALAGYDDIRDGVLRRIAYALTHPEIAATYGIETERPSLLMDGPPGTGKTTFARVIAGLLQRETGQQCKIRKINGAELLSPYVGETEQRIRSLVREMASNKGWSILFIDEVDAIARIRGSAGNVHSDRFLSTWLSELEGFEGRCRFLLVVATNRPDMLDAAFRSRFSQEIHVPRPRLDAARAIFNRHLAATYLYYPGGNAAEKNRLAMIESALAKLYLPNVSGATIATLRFRDGKNRTVMARDLISGRLIEQICVEARQHAFQRHIEGCTGGVCAEDLDAAVEAARDRLRKTLTPQNAHSYLTDLPSDAGVVAVDPAPRSHASIGFLHRVAS